MVKVFQISLVVLTMTGCQGHPQSVSTTTGPQPTPGSTAGDSLAPAMVPDPVPVVPDSGLTIIATPRLDPARARRLVAQGRGLTRATPGHQQAIDRFLSALSADSTYTDAWWELGLAYQAGRQWDQALDAWLRLADLDSTYAELSLRLPVLEMRRDVAAAAYKLPPGSWLSPEEDERKGSPVRFTAVGDIQLGMGWPENAPQLPPDNASPLFERVLPLLSNSHVVFGNLETVLADSGESTKCRRGSRNCYAFRAPTAYAATLRASGFSIVSANNNHAGDFGEDGRIATTAALSRAGVLHSGPSSGIASWEAQGLQIALVAFSTGEGPYRVQDIDSARAIVIQADRDHDLVIVSFHGGAEGAGATKVTKAPERAFGEDRGDVYAFSHALVDAGADLILGHGPHVLRAMEVYRGRLIAFSLGNFTAWHAFNLRGPLGVSAILDVSLAPNGVVLEAQIHPVYLESPGIPTPDPEARAIDIIRRLSLEDLGDSLFDAEGRYRR